MKKIYFLTASLLFTVAASAQITVNERGQLVAGPDQKNLFSYDTIPSILYSGAGKDLPGTSVGDATVPLDTLAAINVLGRMKNNSGGYITFGDRRNVSVGEWGGTADSNRLLLRGTSGIRYEDSRGEIFRCLSNNDFFTFFTDLRVNGVRIASDSRLKSDIEEIGSPASDLDGITPVSYRLTSASPQGVMKAASGDGSVVPPPAAPDPRTRYGFVAQEVREVFPDLVSEDADGYLSVDYIGFIPILVKAVKDLRAQVAELTAPEAQEQRRSAPGMRQDGATVASLSQNRPNPFTSVTVIDYTLPEDVTEASIRVYDLQGKQVLKADAAGRGRSSVSIDGSRLQPGMYVYALIADGVEIESRRMILTD